MSQPAPAGAVCAQHPEVAAGWVCGRCGQFMCWQCERRTRPEALPMCPGCWELRTRTVVDQSKDSGTRLQTAGLVLGCLSLLPFPALQIAGLIVNIAGIVKAKEPPARAVRWRPITGLCLTLLGFLILAVLVTSVD